MLSRAIPHSDTAIARTLEVIIHTRAALVSPCLVTSVCVGGGVRDPKALIDHARIVVLDVHGPGVDISGEKAEAKEAPGPQKQHREDSSSS